MNRAEIATPVYDSQSYEPRRSVGALMNRIRAAQFAALDREFARDPALASLEVTAAQYLVLNALFDHDADRMSWLCTEMSYDPGAMTRMVDRLEAKGLISRGRSRKDRRRVCLELTATGTAAVPRMRAHSAAVLNGLLDGFSRDEAAQLTRYLERMVANF